MVVLDRAPYRAGNLNRRLAVLPDPLHPAVVHFPIVLMFLLPISVGVALWAIRNGARVTRAWVIPVSVAAALAGSAWLSVETGEQQEERVEAVVPERTIDAHSDAAQVFLVAAALILVVAAVGMLSGPVGRIARGVAGVASVVLVVIGFNVGRSGGELVYQHGAAAAYTSAGTRGTSASDTPRPPDDDRVSRR